MPAATNSQCSCTAATAQAVGSGHPAGDRWAALEPIRQAGTHSHLGGYAPKIALGLGLRHDWAPQYTAPQFAGDVRWLGIRLTPAYVGEPECNGITERCLRTLKGRVPLRARPWKYARRESNHQGVHGGL